MANKSIKTAALNNTAGSKSRSESRQSSKGQIPRIQSNIQRKTAITVTPQTVIRNNRDKNVFSNMMPKSGSITSNAKNSLQNELKKQNNFSASTVSATITAGSVGIKTFKTAQSVSPYAIKIAKGTYSIGGKTIKTVRTIGSTAAKIKTGEIPLNKESLLRLRSMAVGKIASTKPMERLIYNVNKVRTSVETARYYSFVVGNRAIKAASVTRGVINGTVKIQISKKTLEHFRNASYYAMKAAGDSIGRSVKTVAKKGLKTGFSSIKHVNKAIIATGVNTAENILSSSNDLGAQTLGLGIKSAKYTVRTVKTAPKIVKYGIRGTKTAVVAPIKTGKAMYRSAKGFIKVFGKHGFKKTIQIYNAKVYKALSKAGGSIVNLAINAIKSLGKKVVAPIIIIVLAVIAISNMVSAPVSGVGAIFGGVFTNKDSGEDFDVHDYLVEAIEPLRQSLVDKVNNIKNSSLVSGGGSYHYIRLFTDTDTEEIDITTNSILNSIFTTEEFANIIQPFFQTIILTEYNLEPTQSEIDNLLRELWDTLVNVSQSDLPTEYCNANICTNCDAYHANIATCPNIICGTHSSYTCSRCCYRYVTHDKTVIEGCNGYYHCGGHKILKVTISLDGYYELLAKYFTDPIDELANLESRTPEQEEKLQTLKDNYDLCLTYMEMVLVNYGGSDSDISGVKFVNGSRPNNDALVKIAEMQLGNIGGKPFWSWYGFDGRVEWCACFVSWCCNQLGYLDKGIVPKFCSCREGVKWFKEKSQWAAGGYTEPVAGDIIFFDWNGDGIANHVGLVVGNDGNKVYTIEGNSGDACKRRSYPLNSSVILGYGLPNY